MWLSLVGYDVVADCSGKGESIKQRFAYPFSFSNLIMKWGHLDARMLQLSTLSCSYFPLNWEG